MPHALDGLLTAARREAHARQQKPRTAHVLLAILRDPEAARVVAAHPIRAQDLVSALKLAEDETSSAVEVAVERATAIATRSGAPHARPVHLLYAVLTEPRWTAFRCLDHMGASAAQVREAALGAIEATSRSSAPEASRAPADARRLEAPRRQEHAETARPEPRRPLVPAVPRARASMSPPRAREPRQAPANRRVERAPDPSPKEALGPCELDRAEFPLLSTIGRNLSALAAAGKIDPVLGRQKEISQLLDVLGRRRANNPLLVGPSGVGKTAIVEGVALELGRTAPGSRILVEISPGSLLSGTGVRGAAVDRIRKIQAEVLRSEGRVLLFLDEIHAVVGAEGEGELAQELKSALARGELPCIGATTDLEHDRYIARDPALARRFTRLDVEAPDAATTLRILQGVLPRYEIHHAVAYDPEAVQLAVELTIRFLPERHLPDKALSALDLAAARVHRAGGSIVDPEAVARVVADEAHVPLERLLVRDAERLLALEAHLAERVVGQDEAIARIADAMRKGAAGFRGKRPLSTLLLLGPTGVGKTETAKAIADVMFGPGGMSRFDMSEYGEPHAVARLLGAPPGYVGHDEGGQLTECVRRRPYQLVLLDEIEKAHPDVLLSLLPLLDEGRLTDGRGRTVDFTNTVIAMTSNLGAEAASPVRAVGFGAAPSTGSAAERALAAARRAMPPELWNRIEEPLYFAPLRLEDVREIARRMLAAIAKVIEREHRVVLGFEESVVDVLLTCGGFEPSLGARPMRRTVGRLVEAPLAAALLGGEIVRGERVVVRGAEGRVHFGRDEAEAAE